MTWLSIFAGIQFLIIDDFILEECIHMYMYKSNIKIVSDI